MAENSFLLKFIYIFKTEKYTCLIPMMFKSLCHPEYKRRSLGHENDVDDCYPCVRNWTDFTRIVSSATNKYTFFNHNLLMI